MPQAAIHHAGVTNSIAYGEYVRTTRSQSSAAVAGWRGHRIVWQPLVWLPGVWSA